MVIGYILALVFAVLWFVYSIYDNRKKDKAAKETVKKAVEKVKECDTDLDDLIL